MWIVDPAGTKIVLGAEGSSPHQSKPFLERNGQFGRSLRIVVTLNPLSRTRNRFMLCDSTATNSRNVRYGERKRTFRF